MLTPISANVHQQHLREKLSAPDTTRAAERLTPLGDVLDAAGPWRIATVRRFCPGGELHRIPPDETSEPERATLEVLHTARGAYSRSWDIGRRRVDTNTGAAGAPGKEVTAMRKVKDLTGPGHTDHFGIGGTDLGAMTTAPDGRLVAVLGDTFERAGVGGPGWRSPVVLFADPATVGTGIEWTGSTGAGAYAEQALPYHHDSVIHGRRVSTVLPTDVITIGDEMYLHVMVCEGLGNVHWTEVHRSTDNGETWHHTGTTWPGDHLSGLFQMLTWARGDDGYVYAFSTGFQRSHGLVLQRVPADRVTEPGAWEGWGFRDGEWAWGNPPTIALAGAYGELCLRPVGDRWLLVFFDAGNYRIDAMSLRHPTSNLYEAPRTTVLRGGAWDREDHVGGHVAQLYGGYVVPGSTPDALHLVVSQWNTQHNWPYRVMQFAGDAFTEASTRPEPSEPKRLRDRLADTLKSYIGPGR